MGLFKRKKKEEPNDFNDFPAMPDLPQIDEPPVAGQTSTAFGMDVPDLPDLDFPQNSNVNNFPKVPNPQDEFDIPAPAFTTSGVISSQNRVSTGQNSVPNPSMTSTEHIDSLDNFNISDEDLEGLQFDEPLRAPPANTTFVPQTPKPEDTPAPQTVREIAKIPEPPLFDDTEGPLFVTTKKFRTVIGMLDDSTRQIDEETTVGSELLNNNGLQLKSLEHLHTEFMQIYKKLNTVDEILFERNT